MQNKWAGSKIVQRTHGFKKKKTFFSEYESA